MKLMLYETVHAFKNICRPLAVRSRAPYSGPVTLSSNTGRRKRGHRVCSFAARLASRHPCTLSTAQVMFLPIHSSTPDTRPRGQSQARSGPHPWFSEVAGKCPSYFWRLALANWGKWITDWQICNGRRGLHWGREDSFPSYVLSDWRSSEFSGRIFPECSAPVFIPGRPHKDVTSFLPCPRCLFLSTSLPHT